MDVLRPTNDYVPSSSPWGLSNGQRTVLPDLAPGLHAENRSSIGWLGGDSGNSHRLPDGSDLWAFADSFIGTANTRGIAAKRVAMVNNALVRVRPDGTTQTLVGVKNSLGGGMTHLTGTMSSSFNATSATLAFGTWSQGYQGRSLDITLTAGTATVLSQITTWRTIDHDGREVTQATIKARVTADQDVTITPAVRFTHANLTEYASGAAGTPGRGTPVAVAAGQTVDINQTVDIWPAGTFAQLRLDITGAAGATVKASRMGLFTGDRRHQGWQAGHFWSAHEAVVRPETAGLPLPAAPDEYKHRIWLYDGWQADGSIWQTGGLIVPGTNPGAGAWNFAYGGSSIFARWDAATLAFLDARAVTTPFELAYGATVNGSTVYLWGVKGGATYLVATSATDPGTVMRYRTASGWTADPAAAVPVCPVPLLDVRHIGGRWRALHIPAFTTRIRSYSATSLVGPWTLDPIEQSVLMSEVDLRPPGIGTYGYLARFHPQMDPPGMVAVSYCKNVVGESWGNDVTRVRPSVTATTVWGSPTTPPTETSPI